MAESDARGEYHDVLERIARAGEQIALSLQAMARTVQGPQPELRVQRPEDQTGLATANLHDPGELFVHLYNAGSLPTTISEPALVANDVTMPASIRVGQGETVELKTLNPEERCFLSVAVDPTAPLPEVLILRVPHKPAAYPAGAVLVSELRSVGMQAGRPGWEPSGSHLEPLDAA